MTLIRLPETAASLWILAKLIEWIDTAWRDIIAKLEGI